MLSKEIQNTNCRTYINWLAMLCRGVSLIVSITISIYLIGRQALVILIAKTNIVYIMCGVY